MRYDRIELYKLALGGALILSALFVLVNLTFAYDQQNTHPALTDEAVDFYNLNFLDKPLSDEDKIMLIQGAIEEDTPVRWLNHFYDPVYNTGWIGYTSAKDWAYNSNLQIAFYAGANYGGFANLLGGDLHPQDYSYQRALYDYATGNRKRAMLAMGHVMHLLEDSNVPEHTRGDTHLPWHGTESPYEKEMAKWNPTNANVAEKLKETNAKPVFLSDINQYFNEIATYSNGYFFSQDTIGSIKYLGPKILKIETRNLSNKNLDFAIGVDKNKNEFILAQVHTRLLRNIVETKDATLISQEVGTLILDDYWSRLSKDFVIHGAGALKLFLDQAELVKKEYENKQKVVDNSLSSSIGRFFGFLGWGRTGVPRQSFDPDFITDVIKDYVQSNSKLIVAGVSDDVRSIRQEDARSDTDDVGGVTNDVADAQTQLPTPFTTPFITPTSSPTPLPGLTFLGSSGGSGSSASNREITSTPLPLETAIPTPSPTHTPTPESILNHSPAGEPTTILDLAVDQTSFFGNIKLTWSAPSDTDSPIASLSYDLRYATKSFDTIADWDYAMPISNTSLPVTLASPGQTESASFAILDYNQTYHFAIKTSDGEHQSSISNQAQYAIKPAISNWQSSLQGPILPSISWQFQAPEGFFINQPAIGQDGTIYFGISDNLTHSFYAVTSDSLEKWRFSGLNGPPSTPTILDDGTAYFGQFDHGSQVTAVDRNGQKSWEFDIGDRVNGVIADEKGDVYFTSENKWVSAIGPKGEKKWQLLNNFTFGSTPLVIQQDAYTNDIFLAANNAGQPEFYRISRDGGSIIWQKRNSDSFIYSTFDPVYDLATDMLYAPTTGFGQMLAINPVTGSISKEIFDFGAWPTTRATIVNDLLMVGVNLAGYSPASGSAIYAMDIANLASIQWKLPLESPPISQIIKDRDNNLYFATKSGKIYSITADGSQRWMVDLGLSIDQYPVLGDKSIYIGIGGKLIKIAD